MVTLLCAPAVTDANAGLSPGRRHSGSGGCTSPAVAPKALEAKHRDTARHCDVRQQEETGNDGKLDQLDQLAAGRELSRHALGGASVGPHALLQQRLIAEGTQLDAGLSHRAAATTLLRRPRRLQRHFRAGTLSAVTWSTPQCKARVRAAEEADVFVVQQRGRLPPRVRVSVAQAQ